MNKIKESDELIFVKKELAFQNTEKENRAAELIIANKELAFQNREKEKRAEELVTANKELVFQNGEKEKRAEELVIANNELAFQNSEKENRAAELIIANKELVFQNGEKENRAAEFVIASKELNFQNGEKEKRAEELVIANKELDFQNIEKENRAAELVIANNELSFQNAEKEKRAAELIIANQELIFQALEKEKCATELIASYHELAVEIEEKGKRAAELFIANIELAFQNEEKEKRAAELTIVNSGLKKAEADVRKLNEELEQKVAKRTAQYTFLSHINQTIVHSKDAETLLANSCRIALEFGKFKMAWIGMFNTAQKKITLLDQCGILEEDIKLFNDAYYKPNGPQDHVLSTGEYYHCNNIENIPELENWKSFAVKHNILSFIVLPLKKSGSIFGTLNLYATELNFFGKEDITLLLEVAGDISFALDNFEKEKKHAATEELVIKNEKRFRALVENGSDAVVILSPAGSIVYISPSIGRILGYTEEEAMKLDMFSLIHPDDLPDVLKVWDRVIATSGVPVPGATSRLRHKDGTWRWLEATVTNMLHDSSVNGIIDNFRDVTEKIKIEEQREFDNNNLHALINNTKDLMWSVDRDFNLITSNQPFQNIVKLLSGKPIEKGSNILEVDFSPEQLNRHKEFYERAFKGETFTEIEYTDTPVEFWSEISYQPIRKGNEIIGTACHSRNITIIKKAERQLRKSEAFNRGVLNSLSAHIAVIDAVGNIVAVNETWKRFGMENGDTSMQRSGVGSNYFEVCSNSAKAGDETASEVLKGMEDVINEKKPIFYFEYACHSPNSEQWFAMRVKKFDSDQPMIIITHQDISERKFAELERIKITSDLIQRNKDLMQFSYIVSHNLRSPVANILGTTSILNEAGLSAENKEMLNKGLNESVTKLDDIVKDLNHILQVKSEINEPKEKVLFSKIVNDIKISISNILSRDNIEIIVDFAQVDECVTVKSYIHSIFYNLISNSIKYRQQKVPCVIQIKSQLAKDKIVIIFTDNGMGIDLQKNGDQVFGLYKKFHQGIEGKGMGLFMIKTQLEALGGKISISSNVDKGTQYKIEFEK